MTIVDFLRDGYRNTASQRVDVFVAKARDAIELPYIDEIGAIEARGESHVVFMVPDFSFLAPDPKLQVMDCGTAQELFKVDAANCGSAMPTFIRTAIIKNFSPTTLVAQWLAATLCTARPYCHPVKLPNPGRKAVIVTEIRDAYAASIACGEWIEHTESRLQAHQPRPAAHATAVSSARIDQVINLTQPAPVVNASIDTGPIARAIESAFREVIGGLSLAKDDSPRWSKPRSPTEWCKLLGGISIDTFAKDRNEGVYGPKHPDDTTKRVRLDLNRIPKGYGIEN